MKLQKIYKEINIELKTIIEKGHHNELGIFSHSKLLRNLTSTVIKRSFINNKFPLKQKNKILWFSA